ncbi:toxin YdaT family protein [Enterobacter hormaechei]|uniref:toxin YdaT family protein n=1 Tax=Enterobacter hormaechei TaxID=158836 RepID=UPI00125B3410|nr:toxin YdaT family protein [Enterobacter hormaechei]EHN8719225.1 hypothetical protein [Enterobacter hormaechei]MCM7180007.1 toxin YdaT domain-containing protein [Enterobacter hormaechei]MDO6165528.1 toxin YdaT family protein [Enterobacter hormaechei]MDO6169795.1 toxin YdaT family protein [Enterobacter hormaechei]WDT16375.1 hypothetical protein LNGFDJGK_02246 [Enterobacter hormaechei]
MQKLPFQQNNIGSSERLKFQCQHSEAERQTVDHREICSAVRAWAAGESRIVVALAIKEAAEKAGIEGIDMTGNLDVWNVKLFRWLDNHNQSPVYRSNIELLAPAIISVLPLQYRNRLVKNDSFAYRMARLEKEVSEAKQALMLDAPKKEKLKELGEGIFEMFRVDPDLTAPLLAMVTTMLGAM